MIKYSSCQVGSTVVEHSTHNPKIEGSNPAAITGGGKMAKQLTIYLLNLHKFTLFTVY
jgi:hypothetical protein